MIDTCIATIAALPPSSASVLISVEPSNLTWLALAATVAGVVALVASHVHIASARASLRLAPRRAQTSRHAA